MNSKRGIILVLAILGAVFLLFGEIVQIISTFLNETARFFGAGSIGGDIFISYIKTILTILMLAYLFIGFGGKFQSPLISIVNIIDDITGLSMVNISKKDRIALFLSLTVIYIGILFYTKYLVVSFATTTSSILGILYQIISIAIYFGISYFTLILLRNANVDFIKTNNGFIKITLYGTIYLFLLGLFNEIFGILIKIIELTFNKII